MDNYGTTDPSMGVTEDPLHQVLALEQRAEGIVRDAEAEADRITATADERIAAIAQRSEQDIKSQIDELQVASDQTVHLQAEQIDEKNKTEWHNWETLARKHLEDAVRFVVSTVLAGEDR